MDNKCKLNSTDCYGVKELDVLLELSSLLSNKDTALDQVIKILSEHLNAERFILTILNRENSNIVIEGAYGMTHTPVTIDGLDFSFICYPIRYKGQTIGTLDTILGKIEKQIIMDALISSKGNGVKAAESLGITERMMGLRIRKYEIDPKRVKTKNEK